MEVLWRFAVQVCDPKFKPSIHKIMAWQYERIKTARKHNLVLWSGRGRQRQEILRAC